MTYLPNSNYALNAARGLLTGVTTVNKFGAAPAGVQLTATDIWSRADAAATQQIWVPPTTARVHAIVSSSASDDGDPAGVGARTVRIHGLTAWNAAEVSEDITLNGTGAVNTANSYVIIHRMKVLTSGATSINVGTISATAATDTTITAVILPGEGQTEMAIYGVPSTQSFYMCRWYCGIAKASGTAVDASFVLLVNETPTTNLLNYLYKSNLSLQSTGTSAFEKQYCVPVKYSGPCIIKVQATASAADVDATSGFDGYLINN
jgi:hypothetical protein